MLRRERVQVNPRNTGETQGFIHEQSLKDSFLILPNIVFCLFVCLQFEVKINIFKNDWSGTYEKLLGVKFIMKQ